MVAASLNAVPRFPHVGVIRSAFESHCDLIRRTAYSPVANGSDTDPSSDSMPVFHPSSSTAIPSLLGGIAFPCRAAPRSPLAPRLAARDTNAERWLSRQFQRRSHRLRHVFDAQSYVCLVYTDTRVNAFTFRGSWKDWKTQRIVINDDGTKSIYILTEWIDLGIVEFHPGNFRFLLNRKWIKVIIYMVWW